MWKVLKHTFKQSIRSVAFLSAGAASFFYVVIWSSASFTDQIGQVGFFASPPRAFRAMLGSSDFLSPKGWIAIGLGHPLSLALFAAAAIGVASGGVAAEIERGTVDFVLARPIRRTWFLAAKAAAALAALTIVEVAGLVGTILARSMINKASVIQISGTARGFLGSWVLFASFALIALLISSVSSLRSKALGISLGVLVGSFFLNVIALLVDQLYGLRFLSLFHYIRADELIAGASAAPLLVPLTVGLLAGTLAFIAFARRDIVR